MESINRHPLEVICSRSKLSMLEVLIPFVDFPWKFPLALFIKLDEIRLIAEAFQCRHTLCKLGLHNPNTDMMDILCSLTGMSPDMLRMIMSFMENTGDSFSPDMLSGLMGTSGMDFSNLSSMFGQNADIKAASTPDNNFTNSNPFSFNNFTDSQTSSNDDFDQNIQNILAQYDSQNI